MSVIILIAKVLLSIFLTGFFIGGIVKLSPAHRNPDTTPAIEKSIGVIGISIGLAGLYFTWFN
jgi:hypothetical protein